MPGTWTTGLFLLLLGDSHPPGPPQPTALSLFQFSLLPKLAPATVASKLLSLREAPPSPSRPAGLIRLAPPAVSRDKCRYRARRGQGFGGRRGTLGAGPGARRHRHAPHLQNKRIFKCKVQRLHESKKADGRRRLGAAVIRLEGGVNSYQVPLHSRPAVPAIVQLSFPSPLPQPCLCAANMIV